MSKFALPLWLKTKSSAAFFFSKDYFRSFGVGRFVALLLLLALISPMFLTGEFGRAKAQSRISVNQPAPPPVNAPPQPFVTSSGNSPADLLLPALEKVTDRLNSGYQAAAALFKGEEIPPEFSAATPQPAFFERLAGFLAPLFFATAKKPVFTKEYKPLESEATSSPATAVLPTCTATAFDFDGDCLADYGRWQANSFQYKIYNSGSSNYTTLNLGSSSAKIAPADFDGDGKFDMAVFTAGSWTVRKSTTGTDWNVSWGTTGDIPIPADYDGDGTADFAIYRPSTNTFWVLTSSSGYTSSTTYTMGASGDQVIPGDYDGDGKADHALFRPSTGYWSYKPSSGGSVVSGSWGLASDVLAPGDYDGDGKTDKAIFRPSTGYWWVQKSSGGSPNYYATSWGDYGDQPVPADYDGDGKDDLAVYRPTNGTWWVLKSSGGTPYYVFHYLGTSGDMAVPSAFLEQAGAELFPDQLAPVRLAPINQTGGTNYYSRNIGWSRGLVSLPGRAGLDLNIGIGYNSLVWTKIGSVIALNVDNSNLAPAANNIAPGFNFGFPRIEPAYFNSQTSTLSYLMVSPSGARTEFRQSAASDVYETADSGFAQLKVNNPGTINNPTTIEGMTLTVTTTDGTQLSYSWINNAYLCTKIKDRNGNYLTISHNGEGKLTSVTDTLGRVVTVNYDGSGRVSTITQNWQLNNGSSSTTTTHTWATFTYTTKTLNTSFAGGLTVYADANGTNLSVLDKITMADGSYTKFDYNGYIQVYKISNYAPNNDLLNYVWYNIQTPSSGQTDCPRFTQTKTFAANFNGGNEVTMNNTFTTGVSYTPPGGSSTTGTRIELKGPDNTGAADALVTKVYTASSGWAEALPVLTEDYATESSTLVNKRWSWNNWTQEDTGLSYIKNPRITETKVGDDTNTKRTKIYYLMQSGSNDVTQYGLVNKVEVFDSDQSTVLKTQITDYDLSSNYVTRRIIGLPSAGYLYEGTATSGALMSKVTYGYDENGYTGTGQSVSATQHDITNYGTGFGYRGNLTSTTRWDVEYPSNGSLATSSQIKYNIAGSPISQTDPLNHTISFSYTDDWNDTVSRSPTYAYPTTITDPGNFSSTIEYRYDIGANVWARSPTPSGTGNSYGKTTSRTYNDTTGRVTKEKIENSLSGAYTRYEYPTNGASLNTYTTINDTDSDGADADDEVLTETLFDGAGRVRMTRTPQTFNTNGTTATWAATITEYNILGQVNRQSVPTETDSSWNPAGDDYTRGWLWTYQKYDWKGRVTRIINTDGTDSTTLNPSDVLLSYDGCGCAGGEIITAQSEEMPVPGQTYSARRVQKVYQDILGRAYKTVVMDWDGQTPYTSSVETFNGRDQVVSSKQYDGAADAGGYCPTGTCQETTQTYDGHGRLSTRHLPQQNSGTHTSFTYNADDTVQTETDARGAATNYTYNSRQLVTEISYSVPTSSEIEVPPTVNFGYDNAGNRIWMTDAPGRVDYEYDELSRLKNELREFDDYLPQAPESGNKYRLSYNYTLSGGLAGLTDPFGATIYYTRDKIGRLLSVTGSSFGGVTDYAGNAQYRAWGALKHLEYGNGQVMNLTFNNRLKADSYNLAKNGQDAMDKEYQYYPDGSLKFIDDTMDSKFDRLNKYDIVGRVLEARSGAEANGQTETNMQNQPYRQIYSYDPFGNLRGRTNLNWGENYDTNTLTYVNNRIQGANNYDADGRPLGSHIGGYSYDITVQGGATSHTITDNVSNTDNFNAAGRISTSKEMRDRGILNWSTNQWTYEIFESGRKIQTFDGDGLVVKSGGWYLTDDIDPQERYQSSVTDMYYIRSSVLGGEIITTVRGGVLEGEKYRTMVYADGTTLAYQTSTITASVSWETKDASGASAQLRDSSGAIGGNGPSIGINGGQAERDPAGGDVGLGWYTTQPPPPPDPEPRPAGGFGFDWENYYPSHFQGGSNLGLRRIDCVLDGISGYRCDLAFNRLRNGSATLDERLNSGHLLAQFGYVEVLRRKPVYQKTGDRTVVRDDDGSIISDSGQLENGKVLVGYKVESSWEFTISTQEIEYEPLRPIDELRKKLVVVLDNNDSKCRKFLESALKNLKINKTVEQIFDERVKNGGFVLVPNLKNGGRIVDGHAYYGNKRPHPIGIRALPKAIDEANANLRIFNYFDVIIHEMIHREGIKEHEDLARVAFNYLNEDQRKENPLPTKETKDKKQSLDEAFSRYFRKQFLLHCGFNPYKINWEQSKLGD